MCINCKEDIDGAADSLISIIKEVIEEEILLSKPSPYTNCWWTMELTDLRTELATLPTSNVAYLRPLSMLSTKKQQENFAAK